MENQTHEGERLMLFIRRSGMQVKDAAKMMDVTPTSMSRIFKRELLPKKIKQKAISIFLIPPEYFETLDDVVREPSLKYEPITQEEADLWKEIAELKKEVARLADEHRKHGTIEEKLLNIIEQLTKK